VTATLSARDTSVLLGDRGLCYGDGLFETMRAEGGAVPLLERHLDRLIDGCERLGVPVPDRAALAAHIARLGCDAGSGVIKVVVTRAGGARGYRPPERPDVRVMSQTAPLPKTPQRHDRQGMRLQICSTRIGRSAATAGLKHLGRLEQVMASAELGDAGDEGLMLDEHDNVIEGTRCNVFLVRDGRLLTPLLDMSGVAGVMRSLVLESAGSLGLECEEIRLRLEDLTRADEIFMTNAIIGICPVSRIEALDWQRPPGHVAKRLMEVIAAVGVPSWGP